MGDNGTAGYGVGGRGMSGLPASRPRLGLSRIRSLIGLSQRDLVQFDERQSATPQGGVARIWSLGGQAVLPPTADGGSSASASRPTGEWGA